MDKIKCTDNRGYTLTNNQEYDVVRREGKFIFVVNDKDKLARYSAEMFEEEAPLPPPPPPRTEQDLIDSIATNGINIQYNDLNNNLVVIPNNLEIILGSNDFSCGIKYLTGINNQIDEIIEDISDDAEQSEDDLINLQKALFKKCILHKLTYVNPSVAMVLVSTNVNYDEDIIPCLDEISHFQTEENENPNSNNMIKMWGFYPNQL